MHEIVPLIDGETFEATCEACGEHIDLILVDGEERWFHGTELVEMEDGRVAVPL